MRSLFFATYISIAIFSAGAKAQPYCDDGSTPGHRPPSCIDVVCDKIGNHNCSTTDQLKEVIKVCDNVRGGCMQAACELLGNHNCTSLYSIKSNGIGTMCRSVSDGHCLNTVCNLLGRHNCSSTTTLPDVAALCRGSVDSRCIKTACERVGNWRCSIKAELQEIARACSGL